MSWRCQGAERHGPKMNGQSLLKSKGATQEANPLTGTYEHDRSGRGWRNAEGDSAVTRCGKRLTTSNDGGAHLRSKRGDAGRCYTNMGRR